MKKSSHFVCVLSETSLPSHLTLLQSHNCIYISTPHLLLLILYSSCLKTQKYGRTPLELAKEYNHDEIYQLLDTESLVRNYNIGECCLLSCCHACMYIKGMFPMDKKYIFSSNALHEESHTFIYKICFRFCNYSLIHLKNYWTSV